jgi:hypothetical protein
MTTTKRPDRGPDRSPSGPREAHDPGSTRHGTNAGSGANQPKRHERKEQAGFESRQGGDQTRQGEPDKGPDRREG